jgi:hypothetical protein
LWGRIICLLAVSVRLSKVRLCAEGKFCFTPASARAPSQVVVVVEGRPLTPIRLPPAFNFSANNLVAARDMVAATR